MSINNDKTNVVPSAPSAPTLPYPQAPPAYPSLPQPTNIEINSKFEIIKEETNR